MKPKLIIFDLDGTLVDSLLDLSDAIQHTLSSLGYPPKTLDEVRLAIGNGALRLIQQCLPQECSESEIEHAFRFFVNYYQDHCTKHTQLYPGALECLQLANQQGIQLALLTNKPYAPTLRILQELGIEPYFKAVIAGDTFTKRKPDPCGLWWILGNCQVRPEESWMIGDSQPDYQVAHAAGVYCWGYEGELALGTEGHIVPDRYFSDYKELLQNLEKL